MPDTAKCEKAQIATVRHVIIAEFEEHDIGKNKRVQQNGKYFIIDGKNP